MSGGSLPVGVALAGGALLMAWVTYRAALDVLAGPSLMGGLRLVIEAIALAVLAIGAVRALAPRHDGRDEPDRGDPPDEGSAGG